MQTNCKSYTFSNVKITSQEMWLIAVRICTAFLIHNLSVKGHASNILKLVFSFSLSFSLKEMFIFSPHSYPNFSPRQQQQQHGSSSMTAAAAAGFGRWLIWLFFCHLFRHILMNWRLEKVDVGFQTFFLASLPAIKPVSLSDCHSPSLSICLSVLQPTLVYVRRMKGIEPQESIFCIYNFLCYYCLYSLMKPCNIFVLGEYFIIL